jgi:hypothetical protein
MGWNGGYSTVISSVSIYSVAPSSTYNLSTLDQLLNEQASIRLGQVSFKLKKRSFTSTRSIL